MAHSITFSPDAWADYLYWQSEDKKTLKRINKLLQELQRDGAVQGIGKAELLRKIKGMSVNVLMIRTDLFIPLKMTASSFCPAGDTMRTDWRENYVSKSLADRLRAGA